MTAHQQARRSAGGQSMKLSDIVSRLKKLGPASNKKIEADGKSNEQKMLELAEFMQRYSTETITSALARWPSTDKKSWPSIEDISMFMDNIASQQSGSRCDAELVREQQRHEFAGLAVKAYQRVTKLAHGELSLAEHQDLFGLALRLASGEEIAFGVPDRQFWTVEQLIEHIAKYRHFDGYATNQLRRIAS